MKRSVPLDDLAQRINRQKSELETLSREYEGRQAHLADLRRRQEELETQLASVRVEIETVTQGKKPVAASTPLTKPKPTSQTEPAAQSNGTHSLADLIVEILGAAGSGPMKIQALAEEVAQRNFQTKSKNIHGLVQSKITEMVGRRILRRASRRRGVALRKAKGESQPAVVKKGRKPGHNGKVAAKAPPVKPASKRDQPSLRLVLGNILAKSRQPLTAQELGKQAVAAGYETQSKDFTNVVHVTLNKMGVPNVKGKGFQVKK